MSECNHLLPQSENHPLDREIQPFGRCSPFAFSSVDSMLIILLSIFRGPHFVAPLAGVLAGMPLARCAPLNNKGMEFVFMLSGWSLKTVFVFNSAQLISHALVGWTALYPRRFSRILHPAQSVVPSRANNPLRPFHSSCLCQLYRSSI